MKPTSLIIALVLVSTLLFGQKTAICIEDKAFSDYFLNQEHIPKVTGRILNLAPEEIGKIKLDCSIVGPFSELQDNQSVPLNADGSFEIKLNHAFPYQQIWINIDSLFYTGIYVNTDLYIELDAVVLRTQTEPVFNAPGVKYLGSDGALNTFTNNHLLYKRERQLEIGTLLQMLRPLIDTDYDAYIKKLDSLYALLNVLDQEYFQQHPSDFEALIINERQANYFSDLCFAHFQAVMSPELFEKVKSFKAMATSNDGMQFYNSLFMYLRLQVQKQRQAQKLPKNRAEMTLQTIQLLDSLFVPFKADFFKIKFTDRDPQVYKAQIERVLPHVSTPWCKAIMQGEYNKTLEKIATIQKVLNEAKSVSTDNSLGAPVAELPFGARLFKIDAISPDSLLTMLKKGFKNKAMLIDIWAVWCGPCAAEFPHSQKLHEASKDLPVEFVYLCTSAGGDMEKWKTKIVEYQLSGTHIFVDQSTISALMKMFSFSGFPSYMLINTEGVYKPGLAQRPSSMTKEKLAEIIK